MNIINAIINIVNSKVLDVLSKNINQNNRINSVGDGLEEYIRDVFADTLNENDYIKKLEKYSETFSYIDKSNQPPDIILKNGDAIEVKKIQSINTSLALNSSYPKSKLYSDSPLLNEACRNCENNELNGETWKEKDILYIIGTVPKNTTKLKNLIFLYGEDFAADKSVYEKITDKIKKGVLEIEGVEFASTKELGKVKKIDPLGITDLRMRGMWHIQNPMVLYKDIIKVKKDASFNLTAIINKKKWEELENSRLLVDLATQNEKLTISKSKIQDTNNPAKIKDVIIINYYIE